MVFGLGDLAFMGAVGGALWTPANITTELWLDASDNSTIATISGGVSQWSDKSGNGRHVIQATATRRPIVASAVLSGKNIIRFDGVDDKLATVAPLYQAASLGIYAVVANRNPSGESAWAGQYQFGSAGRTIFYQNGISTRSAAIVSGGNSIEFDQVANSNFHLFGYDISGANGELFYEAVSRGTASNFTNQISSVPFSLGDMSNGPVVIVSQLDAAEVICLSAPASFNVRPRIEGYLAHKWDLTANLPSDHPYKSAAPTA